MLFPDYKDTKLVYHVAPITDLDDILKYGIKYDDKNTYISKYIHFHRHIDSFRNSEIPQWVVRERSIFASLNFAKNHTWHSHTVILGLSIDENKCWVANENLANLIYEPFILKDTKGFECAQNYIMFHGNMILDEYWNTSLSFLDNLNLRRDLEEGYDAEALILHDIPPEHIKPLAIISDHKIMTIKQWKEFFYCGGG